MSPVPAALHSAAGPASPRADGRCARSDRAAQRVDAVAGHGYSHRSMLLRPEPRSETQPDLGGHVARHLAVRRLQHGRRTMIARTVTRARSDLAQASIGARRTLARRRCGARRARDIGRMPCARKARALAHPGLPTDPDLPPRFARSRFAARRNRVLVRGRAYAGRSGHCGVTIRFWTDRPLRRLAGTGHRARPLRTLGGAGRSRSSSAVSEVHIEAIDSRRPPRPAARATAHLRFRRPDRSRALAIADNEPKLQPDGGTVTRLCRLDVDRLADSMPWRQSIVMEVPFSHGPTRDPQPSTGFFEQSCSRCDRGRRPAMRRRDRARACCCAYPENECSRSRSIDLTPRPTTPSLDSQWSELLRAGRWHGPYELRCPM